MVKTEKHTIILSFNPLKYKKYAFFRKKGTITNKKVYICKRETITF